MGETVERRLPQIARELENAFTIRTLVRFPCTERIESFGRRQVLAQDVVDHTKVLICGREHDTVRMLDACQAVEMDSPRRSVLARIEAFEKNDAHQPAEQLVRQISLANEFKGLGRTPQTNVVLDVAELIHELSPTNAVFGLNIVRLRAFLVKR